VFTARYALDPYITHMLLVFKRINDADLFVICKVKLIKLYIFTC